MLTSLYIHIPFCNQICSYCDFHKEIAKDLKIERYIYSLIKELKYHQKSYDSLETIYIGGGTPSSLDLSLLRKLLEEIQSVIHLDQIKEYTIETNPNDITKEFVSLIQEFKINRVSVGVQTFHQHHLTFLNRSHTKEDINQAISHLKNGGITNISVDMIFSLINQTFDELKSDVSEVLKLGVNHISYYSLILEEKTKLQYLYDKNQIKLNSEDLEYQMYEYIIDELERHNYTQYEISNFGKPSIHNMSYWTNKEYLGIGSGAHSFIDNKRYFQTANTTKYINLMETSNFEITDYYPYGSLTDEMILGLRLREGISISYINQKYQISLMDKYPVLKSFIKDGYVEIIHDNIRLTKKGIFVGNEIFEVFLEVD